MKAAPKAIQDAAMARWESLVSSETRATTHGTEARVAAPARDANCRKAVTRHGSEVIDAELGQVHCLATQSSGDCESLAACATVTANR